MSKKSSFRGPFEKQHGKRVQPLLESTSQQEYHIQWSLQRKLSWKNSPFLTCQILGLLSNTLAADEKYPVFNRDNLTVPIEMKLSHKQKIFCGFFAVFLKSSINFQYFGTNDDAHRFSNFKITDSQNVAWWMSKKPRLREPFDKQHGKRAPTLLKSASQHLYHIKWSLPYQLSWKTVCYWHAKSCDYLVTHWLPMKSIVFIIERN